MELTEEDRKSLAILLNNAVLKVHQGRIKSVEGRFWEYPTVKQYHDLVKKLYPEAETE